MLASLLGHDIFMDKGVFDLGKRQVTLEDIAIARDGVRVRFSYPVKEAPYDGLVIRREYTLMRNVPEIRAYIEIVPEGGYRPFRLRTVNNFVMPQKTNPNAAVSEIKVGQVSDQDRKHLSCVRAGARFPNGKSFFETSKYRPVIHPLQADLFAVRPIGGTDWIQLTAPKVDQLFVWREKASATLEPIWPDAYPDNDPHKAATWKMSYSLKFFKDR